MARLFAAIGDARIRSSDHRIIRSLEPGEDWCWCYIDEVFLRPRGFAWYNADPALTAAELICNEGRDM